MSPAVITTDIPAEFQASLREGSQLLVACRFPLKTELNLWLSRDHTIRRYIASRKVEG